MELGMVATEVELRSSCCAQTKMVSILIASCEGKGCRQEEGEEMPSSSLTAREIRGGATFQLRRRQLGKGRAANLRKAAFLVSLIFHPQVYRSALQLANFLSLRSNRLWSEDLFEKNPNPYPYIFTLPSHPRHQAAAPRSFSPVLSFLKESHRDPTNLSSPILRCCPFNLPGMISLIVATVCFCSLRVALCSTMYAIP